MCPVVGTIRNSIPLIKHLSFFLPWSKFSPFTRQLFHFQRPLNFPKDLFSYLPNTQSQGSLNLPQCLEVVILQDGQKKSPSILPWSRTNKDPLIGHHFQPSITPSSHQPSTNGRCCCNGYCLEAYRSSLSILPRNHSRQLLQITDNELAVKFLFHPNIKWVPVQKLQNLKYTDSENIIGLGPKIMGSADGYLAYSVENECLWDGPAISQGQVKCSPYGITTFSNTNQLQGQEKFREVSTLNIDIPF